MSVRKITSIGFMTAFLCIIAPWAVHIGVVPVTFATFGVYLVGAVLGPGYGALSVLIYLMLGAIGLPVFSGFNGGAQRLVGVTGGYLVGYVPCAFIVGGVVAKEKKQFLRYFVAMFIGTVVLYILGSLWYILQTGNSFAVALGLCVFPFFPGDIVKIIMASVLGYELNKRLNFYIRG